MKKKKKHTPKKSQGIPVLHADESARVDAFIQDLKGVSPESIPEQISSPEMALVFLEKLPLDDPQAVAFTQALESAFPEKAVQKAARRVVFKLKQKGIDVPGDRVEKNPAPLLAKPRQEAPEAHIGPVDGAGNRPLFVALPRLSRGYEVGMGMVNDEEGFTEFLHGELGKKRMREVRNLFFQNFTYMTETTLDHAATILENAFSLNPSGSDESLRNYRRLRPRILDRAAPLEKPPIYDAIPADSLDSESLTPSGIDRILEHELFISWLVEPEKVEALAKEIDEVEGSPILVTEEQKAGRIEEVKAKAVASLYPEDRRLRLKQRLEETALVLHRAGEETLARTCLLGGASLEKPSDLLAPNPFLMALVERTLALYRMASDPSPGSGDREESGESGPSIIVP